MTLSTMIYYSILHHLCCKFFQFHMKKIKYKNKSCVGHGPLPTEQIPNLYCSKIKLYRIPTIGSIQTFHQICTISSASCRFELFRFELFQTTLLILRLNKCYFSKLLHKLQSINIFAQKHLQKCIYRTQDTKHIILKLNRIDLFSVNKSICLKSFIFTKFFSIMR